MRIKKNIGRKLKTTPKLINIGVLSVNEAQENEFEIVQEEIKEIMRIIY